jgi:hypothetical protein
VRKYLIAAAVMMAMFPYALHRNERLGYDFSIYYQVAQG